MSYAVVRMAKMKSHDLKGMQFHNQRERESKTNPDIDEERSHENYDLANEEKIDYNERVKDIIESQKTSTRKTRKDAVLVNELMITSDRDFFDGLDPDEQKRFFEESYSLFAERYGEQNIAYAVVHNDEKTPHMHMGVVPMRDGRLQSKNVFNRQELLWLQDNFPKHMQEQGFDLERGEKGSTREHLETREFKKRALEKEIDSIEKNLQEKKNELQALNEKVPDKVKVSAKKQYKQVEVKTEEKNIFGMNKKEMQKKPTGNVVLPEKDLKKLMSAANENKRMKSNLNAFLKTDIVKVNMQLGKEIDGLSRDLQAEKSKNKELRQENMELKRDNSRLNSHINDLKRDLQLVYLSTKEFLKERTNGLKAFKNVFREFVGKIKDKTTQLQERQNLEPKRNEFEKLYNQERKKERSKEMEL